MPDRRAEGGAAAVAHGQLGDFIIEPDEALHDHPPPPTRPPFCAYSHPRAISAGVFTVDWPLPEELITGFTTHGRPIAATAARYSSGLPAKRYGEVLSFNSSAASRRMPSRSMVNCVA